MTSRFLAHQRTPEVNAWYEARCVVCDLPLPSGQSWFCSDVCRNALHQPSEALQWYFWRHGDD